MSKSNSKSGMNRELKSEWFKIGEDFYQQTWEQKMSGHKQHFHGGPLPFKVYLKNGKKISADAFKEAKSIYKGMQAAAPAGSQQPAGPAEAQQPPIGLKPETRDLLVAIVSDTHGSIPDVALQEMQQAGVQHILHAGDIGSAEVIKKLVQIAPLTAVLGDCDPDGYGYAFTRQGKLVLAGKKLLMMHDPRDIELELSEQAKACEQADMPQICVCGCTHTHETRTAVVSRPDGSEFARIAIINPGSATQPTTGTKPGFMLMHLKEGNTFEVKRIEWQPGQS